VEQDRINTFGIDLLLFKGLRDYAERLNIRSTKHYWDIYPIRDKEDGWKADKFLFSGSSTTYAIEAAALMGYKEIVLIGVDYVGYEKKESHFFGNGANEGCYMPKLTRVMEACKRIRRRLEKQGVSIYNESPVHGPLDDVFVRRESRWLKKPES
jgi:sugar phosphate isomerase/epimerase